MPTTMVVTQVLILGAQAPAVQTGSPAPVTPAAAEAAGRAPLPDAVTRGQPMAILTNPSKQIRVAEVLPIFGILF